MSRRGSGDESTSGVRAKAPSMIFVHMQWYLPYLLAVPSSFISLHRFRSLSNMERGVSRWDPGNCAVLAERHRWPPLAGDL